ncbi:hypothetical protein NDU88_003033 [Pleurodeles waltl]|uniref:Uncharacterized protein n=1 Tax=Pleurodeles waltl TaxID=8319 RepID=A0AAV7WU61_PLEWA|nr:hypothetical protein NDU88_003033 [Pleurodeles waltl]
MPTGKATRKHTRQLLFSEAISLPRPMASLVALVVPSSAAASADAHSDIAMEHILQEIAAVGHRLEVMDSKITDLSTASNSIWSDIASFQDKATNLCHRLIDVEGQLTMLPERDSE